MITTSPGGVRTAARSAYLQIHGKRSVYFAKALECARVLASLFGPALRLPMIDAEKLLAQHASPSQARGTMNRFPRSTNRGRSFVAIFVSVGFLWALALSASPQLHQRVHPDASRVEHNCAATMIASGNYDHASHPPLVSAALPAIQFSKIPALTPHWVESPFLGARIFEHAPPARS